MNKRILGASAASVVLSAMPLLGVFAVPTTGPITDTVTVTIKESCSLGEDLTSSSYSFGNLANGASKNDLAGSKFLISCNDDGGWSLQAVGAGEGDKVTDMNGSKGNTKIATGTDISSTTTSAWGFRATGDNVVEGYGTTTLTGNKFAAIPDKATTIAESNGSTSKSSVDIIYGVGISDTQEAGTYTGKVTYTLVHPKVVPGA